MAQKKKAAAKKTAKKAAKKVSKPAVKKGASSKPKTSAAESPMPPMKVGAVCWTELNTNDVSGAENFYKKLFGWKIKSMDMPEGGGRYLFVNSGDPMDFGGIGQQSDPNAPPSWLTYFFVKNVDAAAKQVESLGGKILLPAMDIGQGMGRIAVVSDPQGATFGLYTM